MKTSLLLSAFCFSFCAFAQNQNQQQPVQQNNFDKKEVKEDIEREGQEGKRVLALAFKKIDKDKDSIKDGIKIERDALNIQDRSQPPVAIQINFVGVPQEEINKWT